MITRRGLFVVRIDRPPSRWVYRSFLTPLPSALITVPLHPVHVHNSVVILLGYLGLEIRDIRSASRDCAGQRIELSRP